MGLTKINLYYRKIIRETEKAVLILEELHNKEIWLPKSQIMHQDEFADGQGLVTIPVWLLKKLRLPRS